MQRNWKVILSVVAIAFGCVLLVTTLARALFYVPTGEIPSPPYNDSSLKDGSVAEAKVFSDKKIGAPVSLSIPKINVDASVQHVGITWKGNMSTPNNYTDVGWYKYGTLPGEVGSAVIDGHVDNGLAMPGVFKHLKELAPGDDIFVKDTKGNTLHFIVEEKETYYYTEVPLKKVFNRTDKERLNLITCDGEWIPSAETDDHRVVIYAVLAGN